MTFASDLEFLMRNKDKLESIVGKANRPARVAQLTVEAVNVTCPYCGACQDSPDGSQMWTAWDFGKQKSLTTCQDCDEPIRSVVSTHEMTKPYND